jgi:hypothetical protein
VCFGGAFLEVFAMTKRQRLIIGLACITSVVIVMISLSRLGMEGRAPQSKVIRWGEGLPDQQDRIQRRIQLLAKESFDESVTHLVDFNMYSSPSFHTPNKFAQTCLERMLSNRRCIKLFNELTSLSKESAERKCEEIFAFALTEHSRTVQRIFQMYDDPQAQKNTQSLEGTQLAICAAMFYTSMTSNAKMLDAEFAQLEQFRSSVELRLSQPHKLPDGGPFLMRHLCMPDHRFQINTIWLLSQRDETLHSIRATLEPYVIEHTLDLVPWNAATTVFDFTHRHQGVPIDRSLGVISLKVVSWKGTLEYERDKQAEVVSKARTELRRYCSALE